MSEVSWDQVKDYLSNLTIKELADKVKELEDLWGVEAAVGGGAVVMAAADGGGAAAAEEQTEFDALLTSYGDKKIQVIKAIRKLTDMGLKEAKALVDGDLPAPIKSAVSKEDAEAVKAAIEEAGGAIEIK